jgi:hypothetical protein
MEPPLEYRRAKVFRRMGQSSFAVQLVDEKRSSESSRLTYMPGIIHVHCSDVDWGHMIKDKCTVELERRLARLGTMGMFSPSDQMPTSAADTLHQEMVRHVEVHEGVRISLGAYDAKLKAFVGCALKVGGLGLAEDPAKTPSALGINEVGVLLRYHAAEEALPTPSSLQSSGSAAAAARRKKRRSFYTSSDFGI